MFTISHMWLIIYWILYCALHSVLASSIVKRVIERYTGRYYRYYRIFYSLFASITLIVLLAYQFSFENNILIKRSAVFIIISIFFIIPGIILMSISIYKYFFHLSGIDVFFKTRRAETNLQVQGVHRYVRHPLYLGTLLLVWGLWFLWPAIHHLIACGVITLYVFAGIHWEEKKLLQSFGQQYRDYAKNVPMLWPKFKIKN